MMININAAINDAVKRLENEIGLTAIDIKHVENRHFSIIYEITGIKNENQKSYILKISTTDRACENEYNMYTYLASVNIRSLVPVIYSIKYNYLVTFKEIIYDLVRVLKWSKIENSKESYFFNFGKLLKELEIKTGEKALFNKDSYDKYLFPRVMNIKSINAKHKTLILEKIGHLSENFNNSEIITSIVSDFNLCNIHLNESNEFILIDMGDSARDDCYANIAGLYLSIKFGPLHQYYENKKKTELYFDHFLRGYCLNPLVKVEFNLFQIRTLVCMILFVENLNQQINNKSIFRKVISPVSNAYLVLRYKKYLKSLLELAYEK